VNSNTSKRTTGLPTVGLKAVAGEAKHNLRLLGPLALTQLASTAIGITSVLYMGWSGTAALTAGTLALHFFVFFNVFSGGLLTAASPLMAHSFGAGMPERAKQIAGQNIVLASSVALVGMLITWHTSGFLIVMGQPQSVAAQADAFAKANALSFLPASLVLVLRNYAAAAGHPRFGLIAILLGITANAFVGYGLMFGRFGLPELGLLGLGASITGANVLMLLIILVMVQRVDSLRIRLSDLGIGTFTRQIVRLGWPMGLSGLGSVGTFVAATFVIATMGGIQVAAHAIALQAQNVGFALLWGGAQATTIRMGWATGAGLQRETELAAWTGVGTAVSTALVLCLTIAWLRGPIIGLFLDESLPANAPTIAAAMTVMLAVAIYQLASGPMLVGTSALRGLRDTKIPFLVSLTGYWVVGGTLAVLLAFGVGLQARGVWYGLFTGVLVAAAVLFLRLRALLPRALELTAD
jgi:MATE family multidrug resistance protein